MSVNVIVCGADVNSDEYEAALKLKTIIKNSLPATVNGEIVLYASATLYGQAVKDVDLLMVGKLDNYNTTLEFLDENKELRSALVNVRDFCTTIKMPINKRRFMMGNALVVDLIKDMEKVLSAIFESE